MQTFYLNRCSRFNGILISLLFSNKCQSKVHSRLLSDECTLWLTIFTSAFGKRAKCLWTNRSMKLSLPSEVKLFELNTHSIHLILNILDSFSKFSFAHPFTQKTYKFVVLV